MERNRQRLSAGLAVALGCALLTIAFLLGRLTAKPAEAPLPLASAPAQPRAATVDTNAGGEPAPADPEPAAPSNQLEPERARPENASPVSRGHATPDTATPIATEARPSPSVSPERQQVAAYFDQINRTGEVGGGDPQAFASTLLQSLSSGDFSGFDQLSALARVQSERIRSIVPPPGCLGHHQLAAALASDSAAMLERLRVAISQGDTAALMSMGAESHALEARAKQLQALGESIRQRAGLRR